MRVLIMHKTDARWEAGEIPGPELIAGVGLLLADMSKAGVLLGGEGLRASSLGARLRQTEGGVSVAAGPFEGGNELPSGFSILEVGSLDDAVAWARRQAEAIGGEVEIDVRPVTEAWDIGMAPAPERPATRRYMTLRKATPGSEAERPPAEAPIALARVTDEARRAGSLLANVELRPSRRGRRYKHSGEGVRVLDGPFTESKELIAGYVMLETASMDEVHLWALRYLEVVGAPEVDLRELEE